LKRPFFIKKDFLRRRIENVNDIKEEFLMQSKKKKEGNFEKEEEQRMAGWTGLEPATSGVTGQRCNQLYYHPAL
jgi:hypothetical protein